MEDVADGVGGLGDGDLAGIASLQQHLALGGLEQPQGVLDQGGLSGAVVPEDGDHIAGMDWKLMSCSTSGSSGL